MISRDEVLMGRDAQYPLTPELEANLTDLLERLNKVRAAYGKPMSVSSGYRPGTFNTAAGGAKNSSHLTCQACDFHDSDGALDKWCVENVDFLTHVGLFLEDPTSTLGWTHLSNKAPASGHTIFKP